ncbi:hypothetical protein [Dechloromonas sp. CZR5]|uniref:hypothetical protein n=1 Tax=Dechloromonas sp. CZR5 TaxID=2608630 RepID=UPI00123CC812|nr:hypothetical protein [Dechloromonas sp. CZR5]
MPLVLLNTDSVPGHASHGRTHNDKIKQFKFNELTNAKLYKQKKTHPCRQTHDNFRHVNLTECGMNIDQLTKYNKINKRTESTSGRFAVSASTPRYTGGEAHGGKSFLPRGIESKHRSVSHPGLVRTSTTDTPCWRSPS